MLTKFHKFPKISRCWNPHRVAVTVGWVTRKTSHPHNMLVPHIPEAVLQNKRGDKTGKTKKWGQSLGEVDNPGSAVNLPIKHAYNQSEDISRQKYCVGVCRIYNTNCS